MAKHSLPAKPETQATGIAAIDVVHAPYVYFDGAPTFGNLNGIVNVTLCAARHVPSGDRIATDIISVAYLRCSVIAAVELRDSIDKALLLGAQTQGEAN